MRIADGTYSNYLGTPDFALVGHRLPNGNVRLIASKHLTYAQLIARAQEEIPLEEMSAGWMRTGVFFSLSIGIDDFAIVEAATYDAAFLALFNIWTPYGTPSSPTAIESNNKIPELENSQDNK